MRFGLLVRLIALDGNFAEKMERRFRSITSDMGAVFMRSNLRFVDS